MHIPASLDITYLADDLRQHIFKDEERYKLLPNCDFYGDKARCLASHINKHFMTDENKIDYNDVRLVIHRYESNKLIGYVYLDTDSNIDLTEFISIVRTAIDGEDYVYNEIMLVNIKALKNAMVTKNYDVMISFFHEVTKYIYRTATPDANQDAITTVTLYIDFMYNQVFSGVVMPRTYANEVYRTLLHTNYCDYGPAIAAVEALSNSIGSIYFLPLMGEILLEQAQKPYYTEEIAKGMVKRIFEDARFELVVPMIVKECLQKLPDDKILTTTLAHTPALVKYLCDENHKEDLDVIVSYIKEKADDYVKEHPELADFKGFENNDKASYKPTGNFIVPGQKLNEKAILDAKKEFVKNRNKKN